MLSMIAPSCPLICVTSPSVSPNRARLATWRTSSSDIISHLRLFLLLCGWSYLSAAFAFDCVRMEHDQFADRNEAEPGRQPKRSSIPSYPPPNRCFVPASWTTKLG